MMILLSRTFKNK